MLPSEETELNSVLMNIGEWDGLGTDGCPSSTKPGSRARRAIPVSSACALRSVRLALVRHGFVWVIQFWMTGLVRRRGRQLRRLAGNEVTR